MIQCFHTFIGRFVLMNSKRPKENSICMVCGNLCISATSGYSPTTTHESFVVDLQFDEPSQHESGQHQMVERNFNIVVRSSIHSEALEFCF